MGVPPIPAVKSQVKKIGDAFKKGVKGVTSLPSNIKDRILAPKEKIDATKITKLIADDSVVPPIPVVKSQVKKTAKIFKKGVASLVPKRKVTKLIDDSVVPPIAAVKSQVKKIGGAFKKGVKGVTSLPSNIKDRILPPKEKIDATKITKLIADDSVVPPIPAVKSQVKKIGDAFKKGVK